MTLRRRVAAVIESDGRVLMVRQRERGPLGRHDGPLYLTLPGGGIDPGEPAIDAVIREVREEVGLRVSAARPLIRIEFPASVTTIFAAQVDAADPCLGSDPELECDCPRLVGLEWVSAPPRAAWTDPGRARLLLRQRLVEGPERR